MHFLLTSDFEIVDTPPDQGSVNPNSNTIGLNEHIWYPILLIQTIVYAAGQARMLPLE